ncbi:MAG: tetratricopeptide repeat protein [Rhodobacterales bacterium]|jgi:tetratricopeptide (TPR) repeat protein
MKNTYFLNLVLLIGLLSSGAMAKDQSDGFAGPYLAAKNALFHSNFSIASNYYEKVLNKDPTNLTLLSEALFSSIGQGEFENAIKIAKHYVLIGGESNASNLILDSSLITKGDFRSALVSINRVGRTKPLTDRLVKAWALIGKGEMAQAKLEFSKISKNINFRQQARYHEALAVAMVGDFEEAEEILSGRKYGIIDLDVRGIEAYVQILIQVSKNKLALELVEAELLKSYGSNFTLIDLKNKIKGNSVIEYDFITNSKQGIAEVYLTIAKLLQNRVELNQVLLLSRIAEYLRPGYPAITLQVASVLEDLQQYGLALDSYSSVTQNSPNYILAELGRANTLALLNKKEVSVEVLKSLSKKHYNHVIVHSSLGNMLRETNRDIEAIEAYSTAIELANLKKQPRWSIYFYRGILYEKQKKFLKMESDFRAALKLSPNQPDVLNFLGYSLVEQREKLPEALQMIKMAVSEKPKSGYIIDSLGWIYYRLAKYQEAVGPLERAVELLPVDPIVNDHLGDVYWKVGRQREAKFQWKRSLSFFPNEVDAKRIRQKLKLGLDVVLETEKLIETKTESD